MILTVDPRCARLAYTPDGKPLLRRTHGRWTPPLNAWIIPFLLRRVVTANSQKEPT